MPNNRPPVSPAAAHHVDATEDEGASIVIYPASVRGVPPGVQSAEAIPAGRRPLCLVESVVLSGPGRCQSGRRTRSRPRI